MTTQTETFETFDTFMDLDPIHKGYKVIHPLNDAPEVKRSADHLGPIKLTPGCRIALVAVRCYLVAIMLMGAYRVMSLMGAIKR